MSEKVQVLLVDDSKTARAFMQRAIQQGFSNVEVTEARHIEEAHQAFRQKKFQIAIIDNTLPRDAAGTYAGPDPGIDLLRDLRDGNLGQANRSVKTLFYTGTPTPELHDKVAQVGGDAYLEKAGADKAAQAAFNAAVVAFIKEHAPAAESAQKGDVGSGTPGNR
jgi:CheY-like chemotaxis protein